MRSASGSTKRRSRSLPPFGLRSDNAVTMVRSSVASARARRKNSLAIRLGLPMPSGRASTTLFPTRRNASSTISPTSSNIWGMPLHYRPAREGQSHEFEKAGARSDVTPAAHQLGLPRALSVTGVAAREARARRPAGPHEDRHQPHDVASRQGIVDAPLAHARRGIHLRVDGRGGAEDRRGRTGAHARH